MFDAAGEQAVYYFASQIAVIYNILGAFMVITTISGILPVKIDQPP